MPISSLHAIREASGARFDMWHNHNRLQYVMVCITIVVLIGVSVYLMMVTHHSKTITNSCCTARRSKTHTVVAKKCLRKGVKLIQCSFEFWTILMLRSGLGR